MRRYRCDLCGWRGQPHTYIKEVMNQFYYAEALQHVADKHFEKLLVPPLTVEVWREKIHGSGGRAK